MKSLILIFGIVLSINVSAQTKSKFLPIDKTILKLSEDTTSIVLTNKTLPIDYVIIVNKETNKKDTIVGYDGVLINDRKRKIKN